MRLARVGVENSNMCVEVPGVWKCSERTLQGRCVEHEGGGACICGEWVT